MMDCTILNRDGSPRLAGGLMIQAAELSWRAVGGPHSAVLEVAGSLADLDGAGDALGLPVLVCGERAAPAWWGYIQQVETCHKRLRSILRLGGMANRIQVEYGRPGEGIEGGDGLPATDWLEDAGSIAVYGARELRLRLPGASASQALAFAVQQLEARRLPSVQVRLDGSPGEGMGRLVCRGWWSRLGWTYFQYAAGTAASYSGGRQDWLGAQLADSAYAQGILIPDGDNWTAAWLKLRMKKIGSPQDNLVSQLCADAGGLPGTVLAETNLPGSQVSPDMRTEQLALEPQPLLQAGTRYWLKISRSGPTSGYHYYMVDTDQGGGSAYPHGSLLVWNGSAWLEHQPGADCWFELSAGEDTSAQCRRILEESGLFTAVLPGEESGILSAPWRDGSRTCLEEIEQLLQAGDAQGRRFLARVDPGRRVSIHPRPEPGEDSLGLDASGRLFDAYGSPLPAWQDASGNWAHLLETPLPPTRRSLWRAPGYIWIEEARWRRDGPAVYLQE